MSHSSRRHRALDTELAERLARDGGKPLPSETVSSGSGDNVPDRNISPSHGGALLPSRTRLRDLKTMSDQRQAKVLLAQLTECESSRGNRYLRGWAGASSLIGFRGADDEQGRPTWDLFLVERTKLGTVPDGVRQRR